MQLGDFTASVKRGEEKHGAPFICMDVLSQRKSRQRVGAQALGGQQGRPAPAMILIKRVFICLLLTCMVGAVGGREGGNELGENESN